MAPQSVQDGRGGETLLRNHRSLVQGNPDGRRRGPRLRQPEGGQRGKRDHGWPVCTVTAKPPDRSRESRGPRACGIHRHRPGRRGVPNAQAGGGAKARSNPGRPHCKRGGLWMTVTEMRKPGRKLWVQSCSGLFTMYGAAGPELRETEHRQGAMVRLTIPA